MTFRRKAILILALDFLLLANGQSNHMVNVGLQGSFFDPQTLSAQLNDTVTFVFSGLVHTVTQSSYVNPCEALPGGFNSGAAGTAIVNGSETWKIRITNASVPIWYFCQVSTPTSHCGSGMVGVINPDGIENYEAFLASAKLDTATPSATVSVVLTGIGALASQAPVFLSSLTSIVTSTVISTDITTPTPPPPSTSSVLPAPTSTHLGAIIGGSVAGGICVIFLLFGLLWWYLHQKPPPPEDEDTKFFRYNAKFMRRPSEAFLEAKQLEEMELSNASTPAVPGRWHRQHPSQSRTDPNLLSNVNLTTNNDTSNLPFSPLRRGASPPSRPVIAVQDEDPDMSQGPSLMTNTTSTPIYHTLANEVAVLLRSPSNALSNQTSPTLSPKASTSEGGGMMETYLNGGSKGGDKILTRNDSPHPPTYRSTTNTISERLYGHQNQISL